MSGYFYWSDNKRTKNTTIEWGEGKEQVPCIGEFIYILYLNLATDGYLESVVVLSRNVNVIGGN